MSYWYVIYFFHKLWIISELFPFSGSSEFYMKKLTTKNKFQTHWTFTYQYSQELISLRNDDYKTLIDNNTLLNSNATHIAISLTYGLTAVLCRETKNIDHDNNMVNNSINNQQTVNNIMTIILDDTVRPLLIHHVCTSVSRRWI